MKNSILTFLGRDSGFGNKNNSAYIEMDNKLILVDCGFTVFEEIKNKFDFNKYNSIEIIITHLHNDHAGALSQVILYMWFVYNKKVTVISKCNRIKEYLEITGTPNESYDLINGLKNLEFIKTEHVDHLDAYGFKLSIHNKNIVYTGDTNTLKPFLPYLKDTDEFYVDVSKSGGAHVKIDEVFDLLKKIKNNGTEIFLMHIDDKQYVKQLVNNEFQVE